MAFRFHNVYHFYKQYLTLIKVLIQPKFREVGALKTAKRFELTNVCAAVLSQILVTVRGLYGITAVYYKYKIMEL